MKKINLRNKLLLTLICTCLAGNASAAGVLAAEMPQEASQMLNRPEAAASIFTDSRDSSLQAAGEQPSSTKGHDIPPVTDGTESRESGADITGGNGAGTAGGSGTGAGTAGGSGTGADTAGGSGTGADTDGVNGTGTHTDGGNDSGAGKPDEPDADPFVTVIPQPAPEVTPEPAPSGKDDLPIDGSGIRISRDEMKKAVKAGEEFPVVVFVKNTYNKTKLEDIKLQFLLPQGLSMNAEQKTDSFEVKDIQPGQQRKVKVKLIASTLPEEIPTMTMTVKMSYRYEDDGQMKSGILEKNILLPVDGDKGKAGVPEEAEDGGGYGSGGGGGDGGAGEKKQIDPMTPNIIISGYEYAKDLKAGQEFTLKLVLLNTNKQTSLENLVMTVEAGEALSIEDSSNTTYVERMKPRESFAKEMRLKVLPQGQAENAKLEINFKYEYLKKEERAQATSTEKLSIRFTQPDRFSIGDIQKENEPAANEEATLSIPYVNKGKTSVYNMEARMETSMSSEETYKFMGNVEAGSNGTIDFFATPTQAGNQKAKITVTYEDAEGNEKTVEREAELKVTEAQEEMSPEMAMSMEGTEGMEEDLQTEQKGFFVSSKMIYAAITVLLVVIVAAVIRRRRKKKLHEEEEEML